MKKSLFTMFLSVVAIPASVLAANVAVIDSGTDFSHNWLKDKVWVNVNESPGNLIDDDRNGYVDDMNGWNYADNNSTVFNSAHLASIDPSTYTFFEVLARIQLNRASEADKQYWKDTVLSLTPEEKKKLIAKVNFYGEYAHSTHCSGIIATVNPDNILMSARIFPDKTPPTLAQMRGRNRNFVYDFLANNFNKQFISIAKYLGEAKMEVANMSIGTPIEALATNLLKITNKDPTPEQIRKATLELYASFEKAAKPWVTTSRQVLYVIAAGNDKNDNDVVPYFPANLKEENTITVAATNGYQSLADFSNYGKTTVQVAAPGVSVVSSVPGYVLNQTIPMSGTSMAAPFVAGVSSKMRDLNFRLSSLEVRAILMGTVDKKTWLADKVVSGGIVNPERAYKAAEYAKGMSLGNAIARAVAEVGDKPELPTSYGLPLAPDYAKTTSEMDAFAKQFVF